MRVLSTTFKKALILICLFSLGIVFTNEIVGQTKNPGIIDDQPDKNNAAQELITYPEIPGRDPSDKYVCRVRKVGSEEWKDAFVLQTKSKPRTNNPDGSNQNGYVDILTNWTASWIAFEFSGTAVEVEISKVGGAPINKAMVRPVGHASAARIENGKAYIIFDKPANVNVDIDGQMEDTYTGMGYSGPPVHTISLFANPIFEKPDVSNPRVIALNPGESIPSDHSTWDTIYFQPGVHDIGMPFPISTGKALYLAGNSVVHGTIHPPNAWGASASHSWSVYGAGALSSEEIAWAPGTTANKSFTYQASSVHLEGFVVVDPAHHTFNMNNSSTNPANVNIYKNLKILGWRVNGDGVNAFRNSEITGCFFRCQDDHFYYGGDDVRISNSVCWSDFNGAVLYVTKGGKDMTSSFFKDITVIYHRASWHYWGGGRVISFRNREPGNVIKNVLIKNVLVEDPFPAFPPFYFTMRNPDNSNADVDFQNILIENVRQEYPNVTRTQDGNWGRPRNTMLGLDENRRFENITFKNCYYNGEWLTSFEDGDFLVNGFVRNIVFIADSVQFVNITLEANNENAGTVSGGGEFKKDTEITVTAIANTGYEFESWTSGNDTLSVNPQFTFTVTEDKLLRANFMQQATNVLDAVNDALTIYPIPASDKLFVNAGDNQIIKIQMVDLTGRIVYSANVQQQTGTIDLSGFNSGIYFIRVHTSDNIYTTKMIKE